MDWIKVTPDTMPPDMERVIVTVVGPLGKYIMKDIFFDKSAGLWGYEDEAGYNIYLNYTLNITHWMPYPEPAED